MTDSSTLSWMLFNSTTNCGSGWWLFSLLVSNYPSTPYLQFPSAIASAPLLSASQPQELATFVSTSPYLNLGASITHFDSDHDGLEELYLGMAFSLLLSRFSPLPLNPFFF
jgi:hypothetical protein